MAGILLVFEGIDGSGKTTQVELLSSRLTNAGEMVVASKEPTDGQWGRRLRSSASNGRLPLEEELELFIRDRREHVANVINPALADGKIVILDRYFYSTIAYQGVRGGSRDQILSTMLEFAPVPNMVFLLDADPMVTRHRILNGRNENPNEFEREENLRKCRQIFLELETTRPEMFIIDSNYPIEHVARRVLDLLLNNALKHNRCTKSYDCEVSTCGFRMAGACNWANLYSRLAPSLLAK